ncbi:DNA-binding response regulator [Campylobacterota bacterium]|nr:DNA-binding response regulator [Campylobacterota bacterium]
MKRLLVIAEADQKARTLVEKFSELHFGVDTADSIDAATSLLANGLIDLVLIEHHLVDPVLNNFALSLKQGVKQVALVVLSEIAAKELHINTLDRGADDYCISPFISGDLHDSLFSVLVARIEARLRFGGTNVIDVGELLIDPDEEKIYYQHREIELKGKPFEVLTHLARHRDQIISKEQLLDAIWEEPELVTPNVIEVAINQIRQKMDKPLGINTIETVRRRGYRFCFPNCSGQTIMDR